MKKFVCSAVVALAMAVGSVSVGFGQVERGTTLISSEPSAFVLAGGQKDKAVARVVDVKGQPFTKAWRVELKEKVVGDYNVQLAQTIKTPPKKGDVVFLTGWGRRISSLDESGEGRVSFVLEQAGGKHDKVFTGSFGLTGEWVKFELPATVGIDFSETGAHLTVRCAAYQQTVEIADVKLVVMPAGTDVKTLPRTRLSYAGREEAAAWRKAAEKRIDEIRKAALTVTVVDGAGKPVSGASVEVKMKKHEFPFGSCYAPRYIIPGGTSTQPANPRDVEMYQKKFVELFNYGVDEWATKWPHWVNADSRKLAMQCLDWMDEKGIKVRGHTMVWPGWKRLPPAVKELEGKPEELSKAIHEHIVSVGSALRGRVVDWDVVNEPFVNNDLLKILGEESMAQWFLWAREVGGPEVKLYLNETSVPTSPPGDERYAKLYSQAKMIKEKTGGKAIDGVGMQAHFGMNVQPPVKLLGIYDEFAKLDLPVRITELDVDSQDEELQAAYWRDFLIASYSHKNINGIMIWGFWEGAHWRPNAAMFRKDWSERPIAGVWKDLIFKKWWTDASGVTDSAGTYAVRGFLGEYEVSVKTASGTAMVKTSLVKGGGKVRVEVK